MLPLPGPLSQDQILPVPPTIPHSKFSDHKRLMTVVVSKLWTIIFLLRSFISLRLTSEIRLLSWSHIKRIPHEQACMI